MKKIDLQDAIERNRNGEHWKDIASEYGMSGEVLRKRCLRYRKSNGIESEQKKPTASVTYKPDGTVILDKLLDITTKANKTPTDILNLYGLHPALWGLRTFNGNMWTMNGTSDGDVNCQGKISAYPLTNGLDLDAIKDFYSKLDRTSKPIKITKRKTNNNLMAEINLVDLHLGKMAWHGDTPEDYDTKIAQTMWKGLVDQIHNELCGIEPSKIYFIWTDDFFNVDNQNNTTTGGTPQSVDTRVTKMFNIGCKMLIYAVEAFRTLAPVNTFYTKSNHDEQTSYHALRFIDAWFRNYDDVHVDIDAYPRKYVEFGQNLIGFGHGQKENAKRIWSLMSIEAREAWGRTRYHEMHLKHLHSEQAIIEENGMIIRRISSPTASDAWHTDSGYLGAQRKAQTFVYDYDTGLRYIINTPVV